VFVVPSSSLRSKNSCGRRTATSQALVKATVADQEDILLDSDWLRDDMIDKPQELLARQYSQIDGLQSRGVQRSGDAQGEYLIVCSLRNCSIEKCEKYRHSKTTCPDLCHVQND